MAQTQDGARTRAQQATAFPNNGQRGAVGPAVEDVAARPAFLRPPGPIALGILALVVAGLGFLFLHDQAVYVGTDDAAVTGMVVQLGSPTNGQVRSVLVDVGDEVVQGQVVATLALASPQNAPQSPVTQASMRSSIDGVVVGRHASPGDPVTAGRAIISIVDPSSLWIQARIDESQVGRVRAGQPAEVTIPALGQVLHGQVASVGPASTSASAQLSPNSTGGNQLRTSLTVPVRIDVDSGPTPLVLGTSASVQIRVQD